jgi:hypothetical protein
MIDVAAQPVATNARRLVVVALYLTQAGHEFNELMGYREGANALNMPIRILVPHAADAALAEGVSAQPVLETMPGIHLVNSGAMLRDLTAFADGVESLTPLWAALDREALTRNDLLLFVQANVFFIAGIGQWLARQRPEQRPRVFFRFTGGEVIDQTSGGWRDAAAFYRLATRDLNSREGSDGVFFLVHNQTVARAVSHACNRRTFMMPLPKYLPAPRPAERGVASRNESRVYVHLNPRSLPLLEAVKELVRNLTRENPGLHFTFKFTGLDSNCITWEASDALVHSHLEVLDDDLGVDEYFAGIARSDVVLLAYPSEAYTSLKSGVFAEVAVCGKPVVAPAETWIARDMQEGHGVGHVFREPSAESIGAALMQVIEELPELTAAAQAIAERVRYDNASQRYLERMLVLAAGAWDMHPRLQPGEVVEFRHTIDSRLFMRDGWGEAEDWGVWTVQSCASLNVLPEATMDQGLSLHAHVAPWLCKERPELAVQVKANDQFIATWDFKLGERYADGGVWRTAVLPPEARGDGSQPIRISFHFDAGLKSPHELGVSHDIRRLGLGLRKMMLAEVDRA